MFTVRRANRALRLLAAVVCLGTVSYLATAVVPDVRFSVAHAEESAGGDGLPSAKRIVRVGSLEELKTGIKNAQPGDHIVVANGTYTLDGFIAISKKTGTATEPIVIKAETVLGVTLQGTGSFNITNSSHVIIHGFRFTGTTARLGNNDSYDQALTLRDSNNCRITRNSFRMKDAKKAYWTIITGKGDDHRIDRNEYADKPAEGCFVVVYGPPGAMSLRTRIDHNYFHGQTFTGDNGGECMRLGDSNRQNIDTFMTIEYNLFERNTGDVEVISNKTSSNTIRYNTLRGNRGSIVLRHGDDCLVEGNFLLDGQNGIRFYGDNHRIVGNYFAGNSGADAYSTIAIGNGSQADLANGENTYDQPHNCTVAFNTLVKNKVNLVVGVRGTNNFPATGTVIANNIISGDSGTLVEVLTPPPSATWRGNILWGAAAHGQLPLAGFRRVDPRLAKDADGVYRIKRNSPAINGAWNSSDYSYLNVDMDGQARIEPKDVGADEYAQTAALRRPLRVEDVGPRAP